MTRSEPPAAALSLHCIGVEFHNADQRVRDLVALTPDTVADLLDRAREWMGATEVAVLATCNRTEIYVVESGDVSGLDMWHRTIGRGFDDECPAVAADRFHLRGAAAAEHLFAVAAGLRSAALGDLEIVGQIRRARDLAADHGTVGSVLHRLFDVASRVGRRARSETTISAGGAGVGASVAGIVRDETDASGVVTVLGAGNAADAICRELRSRTEVELRIVNRTLDRAITLAGRHRAAVFPWHDLPSALSGSDVVVSAIHQEEPILDEDMVATIRSLRPGWRPLVIDTSARHTLRPVADLDIVRIDDEDVLRRQVSDERRAAVPAVETIVDEELGRFMAWHRTRAMDAVIAELFREAEAVTEAASRAIQDEDARHEVRRAVRRLVHNHATTLRAVDLDARDEKEKQ